MGTLPTVEDVARVALVSRQTVSNVLNSPEIVKAATRTRVEAAIAELGYRPHASARRLRTQKSSTIGIRLNQIHNGISGAVLDRFLHALTEQADERDMRILLFTAADPSNEIEQIRRLRDGADVDAFVLTATFHNDPRTQWLVANEVPFVTFGRPWGDDDMNASPHPWVDVDGHAGVRDATRRLLELGAERIGYIGWPSPSGTGDERRRGWEEEAGLDAVGREALSVATTEGVPEGAAAAHSLLGSHVPPDALVCASDTLALGAMMAATALGALGPADRRLRQHAGCSGGRNVERRPASGGGRRIRTGIAVRGERQQPAPSGARKRGAESSAPRPATCRAQINAPGARRDHRHPGGRQSQSKGNTVKRSQWSSVVIATGLVDEPSRM